MCVLYLLLAGWLPPSHITPSRQQNFLSYGLAVDLDACTHFDTNEYCTHQNMGMGMGKKKKCFTITPLVCNTLYCTCKHFTNSHNARVAYTLLKYVHGSRLYSFSCTSTYPIAYIISLAGSNVMVYKYYIAIAYRSTVRTCVWRSMERAERAKRPKDVEGAGGEGPSGGLDAAGIRESYLDATVALHTFSNPKQTALSQLIIRNI